MPKGSCNFQDDICTVSERFYLYIYVFSLAYRYYNLGTQKAVSLDFEEEYAREGRQGNFKITKLITFN